MDRTEMTFMLQELAQDRLDKLKDLQKTMVKISVVKDHLESGKPSAPLASTLESSLEDLLDEELTIRREDLVIQLTLNALQASLVQGVDPEYDTMH